MAEMITEVYDAFRSLGVDEEKARSAAVAISSVRDLPWQRRIEQQLADLNRKIDLDIERVNGTLRLHAWILGTNTAMLIALLFKVFAQ